MEGCLVSAEGFRGFRMWFITNGLCLVKCHGDCMCPSEGRMYM